MTSRRAIWRSPWRRCLGPAVVVSALAWPAVAAPKVERVGGPPLVVGDVAVGSTVWVGTRGGGLFGWRDGAPVLHLDVGRGLPSASVLQVQPMDDGTLLVGTAQGIVRVDPVGRSHQTLRTAAGGRSTAGHDAGVVRRSPRDGSVLVRLTPHEGVDPAPPDSALWRLAPGAARLTSALPQDAGGQVASTVDVRGECLDIAGVEPGKGGVRGWLLSECRGAAAPERRVFEGAAWQGAVGVAALSRHPLTRRTVLVLVRQSGTDRATRRDLVMELDERGTLQPHCSRAEFDQPVAGLVPDPGGRGVVVAVRGAGLLRLGCDTPPVPLGGDAPGLRSPTVLVADRDGRLWVGTDDGLFVLPAGGTAARHLIAPDADTVPADALPGALARNGEQVLVSAGNGLLELQRSASTWSASRRWPCRAGPQPVLCGPGVYGANGEWLVVLRSTGVLRLRDGRSSLIDASGGLLSTQVLHIAGDGDDGVWVASGASPGDPQGGGLQWFPARGEPVTIALHDRQLQAGAMSAGPEQKVWVASRAGVLQAERDGRLRRLSSHRAEAVFRNARTGAVAAVGATIEGWDGKRFEPVLFSIPIDRERHVEPLGHPVDVVVDNRGRWTILYASGRVVWLDAQRRFEALLGPLDGVPASTRRLLHLPASDSVLLGTGKEGLFELTREP